MTTLAAGPPPTDNAFTSAARWDGLGGQPVFAVLSRIVTAPATGAVIAFE